VLKTLTFIRQNAIALAALFVALGGTSYAALSLPAGSVGTAQLRNGAVTSKKIANGSITPAKLDARTIGGSVRDWAFVNQDGTVIGGSRGTHVSLGPSGSPYYVSWGNRFSHSCAVLANSPGTEGTAPIADSIGIHVNEPTTRHGATTVWVWPYSSSGTFLSARFYIAVVC
jgi:hypothetical protein